MRVVLSPVQTSNKVEFNTVDVESQLFNISATKSTVAVYIGLRSTLLPIRSTLSPVCTGPKRHGRKAYKSSATAEDGRPYESS